MWSPDLSITGGAITGWTSPVFATTPVQARAVNMTRRIVSGVSGTGPTTPNSALLPFFEEFTTPAIQKALPAANPLTGLRGAAPVNRYSLLAGKGGYVANGIPALATFRGEFAIPAGMETYNPVEVASLVSFVVGLLNEQCQGLYDSFVNGSQ